MRTRQLSGWTISAAVLLCLPAYSAETPEPNRDAFGRRVGAYYPHYEWACKAETAIKVQVTPDGKAQSFVVPVSEVDSPIRIIIRRRSHDTWDPDEPRADPVDPMDPVIAGPNGVVDSRYAVSFQVEHSLPGSHLFQREPDSADGWRSGVQPNSEVDPRSPSSPYHFGATAVYWGTYGLNTLTLEPTEKGWVFVVYTGSVLDRKNPYTSVDALTGLCSRETH